LYGETHYVSLSNFLSGGVQYQGQKLSGGLTLSIMQSRAGMDPIYMPEAPHEVLESIEAARYNYYMTHTYSDLGYTYVNAGLGLEYKLNDRLAITANMDYYYLRDGRGYVFGNETGSFSVIRTGFKLYGPTK